MTAKKQPYAIYRKNRRKQKSLKNSSLDEENLVNASVSVADIPVSTRVHHLNDSQLHSAQRQAFALDLGQEHGNRIVQNLIHPRIPIRTSSQALPIQREETTKNAPAATDESSHQKTTTTNASDIKPNPAKPAENEVTAEDKSEFELLKTKINDKNATAYIKHRNKFFGSRDEYTKYAVESDKELSDHKGLRKLIELSGDAQTVFYRWVRKAYENAGVSDVPTLIKQGSTKELKEALDRVRKAYGSDFAHGGFNPRPKKNAKYRYRLGTISEHGMGKAVDVEDKKNPNISTEDWAFIQQIAKKSFNRDVKRWKDSPEDLWKDIKELNDLWVKNIAAEIERIQKEQETAATPVKQTKPEDLKEKALEKHKDLKKWTGGFFTLEWKLVKEFHGNSFTWGATFSNTVDLHHFEL